MELAKGLALVMIVTTMLSAGLQVDWAQMRETLKDYRLLAKAALANFVLVPLVAVLLVRAFQVDADVSTGILLMSMAPGVPFLVNSAGRKQGGSLSFALEIAFLFSAVSIITVPITAALVLPPGSLDSIPAAHVLGTLVAFQLVPLIVGALVAPRLQVAARERSVKILHLIFFVAVAGLVVALFPKLLSSIASVYGWGHLLIIAAIGAFSIAAGWLLGGPQREYRRTLSIATLMRNIGLCALLATSNFEGTLVAPAVIAYFAITFCLSIPFRVYYARTAAAAASGA
jgi:BASS family bile acid:Na+ symporter